MSNDNKHFSIKKNNNIIVLRATIFECGSYGCGREKIFVGEAKANNKRDINNLFDLLVAKGMVDIRRKTKLL